MNAVEKLQDIVARNRAGEKLGIPSWCTAHPQTLGAILAAHRGSDDPILIEATCNQVNQHGGYTGMKPADFRRFVEALAREAAIDPRRIVFGGDHLGPNPWKDRSAREAMEAARTMVRAYVEAGFDKIHLDASMACADDRNLDEAEMAARAADLCAVAEEARGGRAPLYVIGTEVPIPGGELHALDSLAVTPPDAARRTVETHRKAFAARGLDAAFERVMALVVQPGVDMGNGQVFQFDALKAAPLSAAIESARGVFEAHSTDFQSAASLAGLVSGHFAILKVGPALTFAFREAVFAMSEIERRLGLATPSRIVETLLDAMNTEPGHWRPYIAADAQEGLMKLWGLSDRIRYYWPHPAVQAALALLRANMDTAAIPPGLIWQFAGEIDEADDAASVFERIVAAKVGAFVRRYRTAAGLG